MSEDTIIQSGSRVSLYFSLALTGGEVIDSNFERKPASFRLGDGSMLPGFEEELLGLGPGDGKEVVLPPEQAFGQPNPDNRRRFPRSSFEHLFADDLVPTKVGAVVSFRDPGGFHLPGVVAEIRDDAVVVDFNHPLAGKDIVFRVKILSVLPPAVATVDVKL